jgi:four helix bundle protein
MATIQSFEDLEIWKKAITLGKKIFILSRDNTKIARDFSFKDQLKRAALSVSNNIAEGFEYNNNNDFYRFLRIAKGSCGEVSSCLLFSLEVQYVSVVEVQDTIIFSKRLGQQIGSLMKYLKRYKLTSKQTTIDELVTPNP